MKSNSTSRMTIHKNPDEIEYDQADFVESNHS